MQTLQIDKKNALKLYPTASTEFKQMLIDSFGEKFFSQKITDRVKSFEDACDILGISRDQDLITDTADETAYKQLKIIAKALNEGWEPNWDNSNEYKWYPWFYMDSASGFRLNGVYFYCSGSHVGSRLCFRSRELAEYAAKQFEDLYKQFFTIK